MMKKQRQRGVALVTALLVVAIATVAAVEMARRQQLDIRRLQNLLARDQGYSYALATETWGLDILKVDLDDGRDRDHLEEDWAMPLAPPAFEGVNLLLQIEDLQGRFNLNNLAQVPPADAANNVHYQRFLRLLRGLRDTVEDDEDFPEIDPEMLANNLADWLDQDTDPRYPVGAEDDVYSRKDQPYRPANRLMVSPTELRLVEGFKDVYDYLAPYVTALPETTNININTADAVVLRTLCCSAPGREALSVEEAEKLLEARPADGWETPDKLYDEPQMKGEPVGQGLAVQTSYFKINSTIRVSSALVRLQSLVKRDSGSGGLWVLQRSQGDF